MQRSAKRGNTARRMCSALLALMMLGASVAGAQQQETPRQAAVPGAAEPNGIFVVAKPAAAPIAKPATAPAVPRTALVDAEGKVFTPVVLPSSTPASEERDDRSRDNASNQGIRVHGHWVIDVHNSDGTLAEHRDFQNSLVGANDMVGFLYGSEVMSDLAVYLGGSAPPCKVAATYSCDIVHNLSVLPANARCTVDACSTGLTITPTFGNTPALVLAGNLTATQAGTITVVGTFIGICGTPTTALTTVSAASCAAGNSPYGYGALTQTIIAPIAVALGQVVSVTVTISFS